MDEAKEVRQIPIEDIIPNRFQPRINFDEKALNELAESIKQHGIIQPLVLRPLGDKYEIIAGERRYKAATLAGLSTVPGIVTEMDDNTSAEVALIENVQRKDLSCIEEAKSYKSMLERSNMTQEELAKKMGLSQSTIANKLRLLNLCDEVQNALSQEKISERHARALLSINNKDDQVRWLNRIINERLTVRQLDLAIKDELNDNGDNTDDIPKVDINPDIESIINNTVDIDPNKPLGPATTVEKPEVPKVAEDDVNKSGNKFFNYLEDQEVNMSMNEQPIESNQTQSSVPTEEFNFTPEFVNAPENNFEATTTDEIETLDDTSVDSLSVEQQNTESIDNIAVQEDSVKQETIETGNQVNDFIQPVEENVSIIDDDGNLKQDIVEPPVESQEEVINQEDNSSNVQQPVEETNVTVEQKPEVSSTDFVFDDEDDTEQEDGNSGVTAEANNVPEIEPIPIIRGEGIVDPVEYYDTLDPKYIDKVKEIAGLDLKNAINSYREVTDALNNEGFNISIDETDLNDKYLIEININKE